VIGSNHLLLALNSGKIDLRVELIADAALLPSARTRPMTSKTLIGGAIITACFLAGHSLPSIAHAFCTLATVDLELLDTDSDDDGEGAPAIDSEATITTASFGPNGTVSRFTLSYRADNESFRVEVGR